VSRWISPLSSAMTSILAGRHSSIQNFKRTLKALLSDTNLWSTNEVAGGHSVWPIRVLWSLQLNFKPLHANLEPVHCLDGSLRTGGVVKTHKACKVQHKTFVNNCSRKTKLMVTNKQEFSPMEISSFQISCCVNKLRKTEGFPTYMTRRP